MGVELFCRFTNQLVVAGQRDMPCFSNNFVGFYLKILRFFHCLPPNRFGVHFRNAGILFYFSRTYCLDEVAGSGGNHCGGDAGGAEMRGYMK